MARKAKPQKGKPQQKAQKAPQNKGTGAARHGIAKRRPRVHKGVAASKLPPPAVRTLKPRKPRSDAPAKTTSSTAPSVAGSRPVALTSTRLPQPAVADSAAGASAVVPQATPPDWTADPATDAAATPVAQNAPAQDAAVQPAGPQEQAPVSQPPAEQQNPAGQDSAAGQTAGQASVAAPPEQTPATPVAQLPPDIPVSVHTASESAIDAATAHAPMPHGTGVIVVRARRWLFFPLKEHEVLALSGGRCVERGVTDAHGVAHIPDLADGQYVVVLNHKGKPVQKEVLLKSRVQCRFFVW